MPEVLSSEQIRERNRALMNGVLLGLFLGLAISLILDAIPRLFRVSPNPYIEILTALVFMGIFYHFFELMSKRDFYFISEKLFKLLLIFIIIATLGSLFGYYFLVWVGILIPS